MKRKGHGPKESEMSVRLSSPPSLLGTFHVNSVAALMVWRACFKTLTSTRLLLFSFFI